MNISFIIPFHNEEKNVHIMLDQLIKLRKINSWDLEIIPVNDKSTDSTEKILNTYAKKFQFIKPIHRKKTNEISGNSMGQALREATLMAKGDIVVWTMGDCSDDVHTYQKIIKKLESGYDLVFASRYMTGGSKGNLDNLKAFLSRWGTILARILFGIEVNDITNAFRGFKKGVFKKANPTASDFAISPEFAIRAKLAGFKLGEVPTIYHNRIEGVSNFKLYKMIVSYISTYGILYLDYNVFHKPL